MIVVNAQGKSAEQIIKFRGSHHNSELSFHRRSLHHCADKHLYHQHTFIPRCHGIHNRSTCCANSSPPTLSPSCSGHSSDNPRANPQPAALFSHPTSPPRVDASPFHDGAPTTAATKTSADATKAPTNRPPPSTHPRAQKCTTKPPLPPTRPSRVSQIG
jgi:hypothetical protein